MWNGVMAPLELSSEKERESEPGPSRDGTSPPECLENSEAEDDAVPSSWHWGKWTGHCVPHEAVCLHKNRGGSAANRKQ